MFGAKSKHGQMDHYAGKTRTSCNPHGVPSGASHQTTNAGSATGADWTWPREKYGHSFETKLPIAAERKLCAMGWQQTEKNCIFPCLKPKKNERSTTKPHVLREGLKRGGGR